MTKKSADAIAEQNLKSAKLAVEEFLMAAQTAGWTTSKLQDKLNDLISILTPKQGWTGSLDDLGRCLADRSDGSDG